VNNKLARFKNLWKMSFGQGSQNPNKAGMKAPNSFPVNSLLFPYQLQSKFKPQLPKNNEMGFTMYSSTEKSSSLLSHPVKLYSGEYFGLCGIGGILSCGITHTLVTPLDLVKCNVQTNPSEFPNTSTGFRKIMSGGP